MLKSLPPDEKPQLRNAFDGAALLTHACMLIVGFRLEGLGEDHQIEVKSEGTDVHSLPREWNATSSYNYSFRYAHSQSSLKYLIKISRLGGKLVVNGIGLGDDKVHTMDFPIKDFFSESSFPYTASPSKSQDENARAIQDLFISAGRITDLGSLLKIQIIQKLAPGLRKEGYEETTTEEQGRPRGSRGSRDRETTPTPPDPLRNPRLAGRAPPRPIDYPPDHRPYPAGDFPPPGFDDEYEINRSWPRGNIGGPERRPLNIGERDLYPPGLGPNDPFRPLAGGFAPGGGGTGRGGMHPTFDDPLFAGANRGGPRGYDPRAPPGARYDPVGPGEETPWGGERTPGALRGGFGGGGNPYPYGRGDFI